MATTGNVKVRVEAEGAQAAAQDVRGVGASMTELNQTVELVKNAYNALSSALGELMDIYAVQEQAEARLEQVIRSTGGAAGVTAEEMKAMASELQNVTTFGDEATIGAQSLLLTFTRIGSEVMPGATETVLNMSAALGQDLKSSAIQLGKALNDPTVGITALQRVGVSFTESQKAQIQALQESGDIMGAQKIILAELNTEFGGMAEAIAQTSSGQLTQLSNQFGDLKEQLGQAVFAALRPFFSVVASGIGYVQQFVAFLKPIHPILAPIVGVVGLLSAALIAYSTVTSIATVKTVALTVVQNAKKIAELAGAAATGVATAAQWALNAAMDANPIGLIVLGIGALVAALAVAVSWVVRSIGGWDAIGKIMSTVWEYIKIGVMWFLKFGNPIGLLITGLTYLYEKFGFVRDIVNAVVDTVKQAAAAIADFASWVVEGLTMSGDEQVEAVEKTEEKKQAIVKKSYEEQQRDLENAFKKQTQTIELQEAKGVISKEKATALKLGLEKKYWNDLKAVAEKEGADAAEFELKAAQAEQQLREQRNERAKAAREKREKEQSAYDKLRVDNIKDATEKAWAQYDLDVANADAALKKKEISQRVHDETIRSLIRKLKADLVKAEEETGKETQEAWKRSMDELAREREIMYAERLERQQQAQRELDAQAVADEIGIEMLGREYQRIDAKYAYEAAALERALEWGEMQQVEYNARRRQLDADYLNEKQQREFDAGKAIFDGMASLLGKQTALGKASAIASTYMSTYTAATKALEVGPILGPFLAAIITAQGIANVAKIAATKVPGRRAGGPVTQGFYQVGEEGDEFVMNASATARNRTLLEAMNAGAAPGQSFVAPSAPAAMSRSYVDLSGKFVLDGRTAYALVEQEVELQRGRTL